jgi:hypothetical protein
LHPVFSANLHACPSPDFPSLLDLFHLLTHPQLSHPSPPPPNAPVSCFVLFTSTTCLLDSFSPFSKVVCQVSSKKNLRNLIIYLYLKDASLPLVPGEGIFTVII